MNGGSPPPSVYPFGFQVRVTNARMEIGGGYDPMIAALCSRGIIDMTTAGARANRFLGTWPVTGDANRTVRERQGACENISTHSAAG